MNGGKARAEKRERKSKVSHACVVFSNYGSSVSINKLFPLQNASSCVQSVSTISSM